MEQKGIEKQSLTDQDALFMKNHGRFELAYNAQCITENQIILACDVTDQRHDSDQFIPMLETLEEITKELTDKTENVLSGVQLNTDAGYDSNQNLAYLEQKNINGFIPNQKARHEKKAFNKDKFTYNAQDDSYECPAGNKLNLLKKINRTKKGQSYTESYYQCQSCHQCPFQSQCVRSKTGLRLVVRNSSYERLRQEMDNKLLTIAGKTALKRRATDVEPAFGHIKHVICRNGGFLLRGKAKVRGEFTLVSIAHNLKKMAQYLKNMPTQQKLAELLA